MFIFFLFFFFFKKRHLTQLKCDKNSLYLAFKIHFQKKIKFKKKKNSSYKCYQSCNEVR